MDASGRPAKDGVPGDLIALRARTGKMLWRRHFPGGPPANLEPAGVVLCTGSDSGCVQALDHATGRTLWTYKISEGSMDDVSIVAAPGALCLVNDNGAIVALET
jgi:outer membrane protein assembly factor BamB